MLKIPYIPTPYPDETFGSLLTRLTLYNGSGLWRVLLENSGYGRRTISPFHLMPIRSESLDSLLAALGHTYDGMLRQMTGLPFWLAFNNATVPRLRIDVGSSTGEGTRLFLLGRAHKTSGARFCPACLVEDAQKYGEPYLHRHHQLPVALHCAEHGIPLRETCPACGVTVFPFNKSLLKAPPLRCSCGRDLSSGAAPQPHLDLKWQKLSQFASAALTCIDAPWTAQQVRAVLRVRLNCAERDLKRHTMSLLRETYGFAETNDTRTRILLRPNTPNDVWANLNAVPDKFRAPEYCAVLSATGLTFEQFRTEATNAKDLPRPAVQIQTPRPLTVEQARLELLSLKAEHDTRATAMLHRLAPKHYWLLRLHDSTWLDSQGRGERRALPSIDSDRAKIEATLQKSGQAVSNALHSGPWIRTSIRDCHWLEQRLSERRARATQSQIRSIEIQRERAVLLSRAIFSVLRIEQRPVRVHAGLLSKVANVTMHQAQHTIANCPPLQSLLRAINDGKDRRLAAWATRQLLLSGFRPTANDVMRHAGLVTTRINRQFAMAAIATFGGGVDPLASTSASQEEHR